MDGEGKAQWITKAEPMSTRAELNAMWKQAARTTPNECPSWMIERVVRFLKIIKFSVAMASPTARIPTVSPIAMVTQSFSKV